MIRILYTLSCTTRRAAHKLLAVLLATIMVLTSTSCEQSDDIDTIFLTNEWRFTGFFYTANWNKGECNLLDIDYEGRDTSSLHTLVFHPGGAADISMPGCALTAHWTADGKSRAFALTDIRVVNGSLNNLSPFSRKFYDEISTAVWYRGDAISLQLFNADEHYYLLFGPIK